MGTLILWTRLVSLVALISIVVISGKRLLTPGKGNDQPKTGDSGLPRMAGAAVLILGLVGLLTSIRSSSIVGCLPWLVAACILTLLGLASWLPFVDRIVGPRFQSLAAALRNGASLLRRNRSGISSSLNLAAESERLSSRFLDIGDFGQESGDSSDVHECYVDNACARCGATDDLQKAVRKKQVTDSSKSPAILLIFGLFGLIIDMIVAGMVAPLAMLEGHETVAGHVGTTFGYTLAGLTLGLLAGSLLAPRKSYQIRYALCEQHVQRRPPFPAIHVRNKKVFLEFGSDSVKAKAIYTDYDDVRRGRYEPAQEEEREVQTAIPFAGLSPTPRAKQADRRSSNAPAKVGGVRAIAEFPLELAKPRRFLGMQVARGSHRGVFPMGFSADSGRLIGIARGARGPWKCCVIDPTEQAMTLEQDLPIAECVCLDAVSAEPIFLRTVSESWHRSVEIIAKLDAATGEEQVVHRIGSVRKLLEKATSRSPTEFNLGPIGSLHTWAELFGGIQLHRNGELISIYGRQLALLAVASSGAFAGGVFPTTFVPKERLSNTWRYDKFFVSPSGDFVAFTARGPFYVASLSSGLSTEYGSGSRGNQPADYIQFSPDDQFAFVLDGSALALWDIRKRQLIWSVKNTKKEWGVSARIDDVESDSIGPTFSWSPDSHLFLMNCEDGALLCENRFLGGPRVIQKLPSEEPVTASAISPDQRYAALGDREGTVSLFQLDSC